MYTYTYIYYVYIHVDFHMQDSSEKHGVATINMLLKIIGLFCKRAP